MLRAQTRGNSEIHEVFVNKIAVVDLRAGRSDASGALPRWEAVAGTHAHFKSVDLECNKLITERPRQHKATSLSWLVVDPVRGGVAIAPQHTATRRFGISHLGKDFGSSSRAEPITRVDHPCPGPISPRCRLALGRSEPPSRPCSTLPPARPVPPLLPC